MISYSSAVNTDNIKYIETYECQECCKMKKGTPWVNYDDDKIMNNASLDKKTGKYLLSGPNDTVYELTEYLDDK